MTDSLLSYTKLTSKYKSKKLSVILKGLMVSMNEERFLDRDYNVEVELKEGLYQSVINSALVLSMINVSCYKRLSVSSSEDQVRYLNFVVSKEQIKANKLNQAERATAHQKKLDQEKETKKLLAKEKRIAKAKEKKAKVEMKCFTFSDFVKMIGTYDREVMFNKLIQILSDYYDVQYTPSKSFDVSVLVNLTNAAYKHGVIDSEFHAHISPRSAMDARIDRQGIMSAKFAS